MTNNTTKLDDVNTTNVTKCEDQKCFSCGGRGKTIHITTAVVPAGLHLCNKCGNWLKNKLRGF